MTGAALPPPEVAPAPPQPPNGRPDPNFSGEWRASQHDGLEELLRAQGVPERNIPQALASSRNITQHIQHTRHNFRVTVHGYTTVYLVTSGHAAAAEDEESAVDEDDTEQLTPDQLLTGNTMEWQRPESNEAALDGSSSGQRLVVSSGGPGTHSERRMEGSRMVVVNEKHGVRATSWFERVVGDAPVAREEEERKQKLLHDTTV